MKVLPKDEDFACFVDGDTIFTTSFYGHNIENIVKENPDVKCYTCYTNRVAYSDQIAPGVDTDSNDIEYHRKFGKIMETVYNTKCIDITEKKNGQFMSGCMILLQKGLWKKIGGFCEKGMLGVDNDLHKKIISADEKIYLMQGVYIYHWYRWPNYKNKSHLI